MRFDLTKEKRYTLSDATKNLLDQLNDVIYLKIYLEGEGFPAGFKRLQNATKEMLDEFRSYAGNKIEYEFIDPFDGVDPSSRNDVYKQLIRKGLQPTNLKVKNDEVYSEKIIFPGVIASYKGREAGTTLLQNQIYFSSQEVLSNSVSLMEYTLASIMKKVVFNQKPKIGFIRGQGELNNPETNEIKRALDESYEVDSIDLPNTLVIPKYYAGIIIAKPTKKFEEKDKFKIDQYIMNGGKVLWLIEPLKADMRYMGKNQLFDADYNKTNLEDQLFKYGVRLNNDLIQDLQCIPIPIMVGHTGNSPQTQMYPWYYFPMIFSSDNHPIVKNLDAIMFQFVSSIDTVGARGIKKTVLLTSSQYSKALMFPVRVHLSMLKHKPDPGRFKQPNLPVAVLLEGQFTSVFKNRLAPQTIQTIDSLKEVSFKIQSEPTKMIVISDGDVIMNEYSSKGTIYPLGYYRYTNQTFDNKNFIVNAMEYLCDKSNLIQTRTKEVKLRLLDKVRVEKEKAKWKLINIVIPISSVMFFGLIYTFIRKRKYEATLFRP